MKPNAGKRSESQGWDRADRNEPHGRLYKRRGGLGKFFSADKWQPRYFHLKDGILYYQEGDEHVVDATADPRGQMDLTRVHFELVIEPMEGSPTPHTFVIIPHDDEKAEKWRICADHKHDMDMWVAFINKFAMMSGKSKTPPTTPGGSRARSPTNPKIIASPHPTTGHTPAKHSLKGLVLMTQGFKSKKDHDDTATATATAATISSPAPTTPTTPNTASRRRSFRKGGLKLSKVEGSLNSESIEWLMCIVIMNACFLFAYFEISHVVPLPYVPELFGITLSLPVPEGLISWIKTGFFIFTANFVVSHTMKLRQNRDRNTSSSASALLSSAPSVNTPAKSTASPLQPIIEAPAPSGLTLCPMGNTFRMVEGEAPNVPPHTWNKCDYRHFKVRQKGYKKTGKKDSSEDPIYEPIGVDCFCMDNRRDHIAQYMDLPEMKAITAKLATAPGYAKEVPPLFVFQLQLPSDPPASFFSHVEDGPGWAMCVFFRLTDSSLEGLLNPATAKPGLKFFAEWCHKCMLPEFEDWKKRFKVIASCVNIDELGVGMLAAGNAKPVIIRRTSTVFKGESKSHGDNYIEMDVHVHKFDNMAKSTIHKLSSRCGEMFMELGILIEAREESELPELLIGCVGCNKPAEDMLEYMDIDEN